MKPWEPTEQQVATSRHAEKDKFLVLHTQPLPTSSLSEPLVDVSQETETVPPLQPPVHSGTLYPPDQTPKGARWYESWEDFFQNRDTGIARRLESASERDKASWKSLAQNAKKFRQPGKKGPRVYLWEACNSGGFFQILQDRFDVEQMWKELHQEALIFDPQQNVWDYCPFAWGPAMVDGPFCDPDNDEGHIMEHWYTEPDLPKTLPYDNVDPLEFLYWRYRFLTVEPTTDPQSILPFDKSTVYRIVGLGTQISEKPSKYLNSFITSILQRRLPDGHCDLSPTSPSEESFSGKTSIHDSVFISRFPEISDEAVFAFVNTENPSRLLAVHDPLSILQLVRVRTQLQFRAELQYLVQIGARFTILYATTRDLAPPHFNLLSFPIRDVGWLPNADDFRAYMSRLATLFLERPYVVAAAFSRGGIAWRITREVLGIEGSVDALLNTYPDQRARVRTGRGVYWCHELDEGEWFYLVGGYEVLTGS